jgi:hypothetical protein
MKKVMSSASKAETGALFHNGQDAAHIRQILKELDKEQTQPTRITTNNSTSKCFWLHAIILACNINMNFALHNPQQLLFHLLD